MEYLRRLFGQSNSRAANPEDKGMSEPEPTQPPTEPTPAPDMPPPIKSVETLELDTPTASEDITQTDITLTSLQPRNIDPDGVTRPLPASTDILRPTTTNLKESVGVTPHHLLFSVATDVGMVRSNNQDSAFGFVSVGRSADETPDFGIFIVADGMGGHVDGEKASALATRTISVQVFKALYQPMLTGDNDSQTPITEIIVKAIEKANEEVVGRVPEGGTTATAVAIVGGMAYIGHVGDSRIYLIHHGRIEQITRDHSLVQRLVELGQITSDEAAEHTNKNVLYRALGQNEAIEVDTLTRRMPPLSRLVICSDGLWGQVHDQEIADIVQQTSLPYDACQRLVALANQRGGNDNVTVIVIHNPG